MKRVRAVGLGLTGLGVGQIGITLSPGEPSGELLLALNVLFTVFAAAMAWRPEWADGKQSDYFQREASRPWLLFGGGCVVLGLAGLAVAVGSTLGA